MISWVALYASRAARGKRRRWPKTHFGVISRVGRGENELKVLKRHWTWTLDYIQRLRSLPASTGHARCTWQKSKLGQNWKRSQGWVWWFQKCI